MQREKEKKNNKEHGVSFVRSMLVAKRGGE